MRKEAMGIALLCAGALGCLRSTEYRCATSTDCAASGAVCESVGYCSFVDGECSGGRRFDSSAGSYAGQCVGGGSGIDGGIDSPPDVPNPLCPGTYATLPGATAHRYRIVSTSDAWTTQRALCAADGPNAYLAIPDNMTELSAITAAVQASEFWIGVSDEATEGTFLSVNGQPQTFLPWDSGEPDNNGNQDCVYVKMSSTTFLTERCTDQRATVCECDP